MGLLTNFFDLCTRTNTMTSGYAAVSQLHQNHGLGFPLDEVIKTPIPTHLSDLHVASDHSFRLRPTPGVYMLSSLTVVFPLGVVLAFCILRFFKSDRHFSRNKVRVRRLAHQDGQEACQV